jgi:hypothetical protein
MIARPAVLGAADVDAFPLDILDRQLQLAFAARAAV